MPDIIFNLKKTELVAQIQLCSTNPKYKPFIPEELTIVGLIIGSWSRQDKENWLSLTEE